jgi:hypothetical protein
MGGTRSFQFVRNVVAADAILFLLIHQFQMSRNYRLRFNSLAAKVQTVLKRDPFCGHVFVFRGKRGDLLKVLWWSGDGMCLVMKRLERGAWSGLKLTVASFA